MRKTFRRASRIDSLSKEVGKYKRPAQPSFKHNLKASFERNNLAEAWQEFEDSLIEHPRVKTQIGGIQNRRLHRFSSARTACWINI